MAGSSTIDRDYDYERGLALGWYVHRPEVFNEDSFKDVVFECSLMPTAASASFIRGYLVSAKASRSSSLVSDDLWPRRAA